MAASCSLSLLLLLSLISTALTLRELENNEAVSSYSLDDPLKTAEQEFLAFKEKYGKSYPTQEEDDYRFGVFVSHLREAKRNQLADPKAIHGVTKFADLTPAEFRSRYLTLDDQIQLSSRLKNASMLPTANLPNQFDWREKGAVTGVKDQGGCGACWAFSAIASLEGANFLANKELLSLSEQQLIDCSDECFSSKRVCNRGCAGGHFILAYDYLLAKGVEKEQNYPFTETTGSCKVDNSKLAASVQDYSVLTKDADQYAANLVQHGPLAVAIDGGRMKTYEGGIACPPCTNKLTHGVTLVGYGSDGHWIIKNSWGSDWGEEGYYLLCKQGLICEADPMATAITAAPKPKASHIEIM